MKETSIYRCRADTATIQNLRELRDSEKILPSLPKLNKYKTHPFSESSHPRDEGQGTITSRSSEVATHEGKNSVRVQSQIYPSSLSLAEA